VVETRATMAGLHLDDLALNTASFLAPYQTSAREEYTAAQIASAVDDTVAFIHSRPADVAAWLGEGSVDPEIPHGVDAATSSNPPASKKKKCKRTKKAAAKSGKCRKRKSRD
jgi:hypothetical protein